MEHLTAFLTRMPKVELHVHLESTMPGEMLARFSISWGYFVIYVIYEHQRFFIMY